jgi:hypothetical protein
MTFRIAGVLALLNLSLSAKPPAPAAFCKLYPQSKSCEAGPPPCTLCHTITPARNLFGDQVSQNLSPKAARPLSDADFVAGLAAALKAIEKQDADKDGVDNLAELTAGSLPGDANSLPVVASCTGAQKAAAAKGRWNVCSYDPVFAFRKVKLDFCGQAPTRAEAASFAKLAADRAKWQPALATTLDGCLTSRYWMGTDGVLWNMANPKIRPIDSVKSGRNAGPVPLADYEFDYNLFVWINTGDRDVRDLLLAQYFVKRESDNPPTLRVMTEDELRAVQRGAGQYVEPSRRVGMLTTRWFLTVNTMFTAVPRTTAAQAYRAFLGFDISRMEGLHPVEGEPKEYDRKGVTEAKCAVCHSTLDPLTYPFSRYNGIASTNYAPARLNAFVRVDGPDVVQTPQQGMLLGHKVADLLEWGKVAANSQEFARNVVADYWKLLIGRAPQTADQREYSQLWRGLMDANTHNYRVQKMLHALILTDAYGKP